MASVKVLLNKCRIKKDGTYPLTFQVIHCRRKKLIYSPYHLCEENFDQAKGIAVNRRTKRVRKWKEINSYIKTTLSDFQNVIDRLDDKDEPYTIEELVESFKNNQTCCHVLPYMRKLVFSLKAEGRDGTSNSYKSTMYRLEHYLGKNAAFTFEEVTAKWLANFVSFLYKDGLCSSTVSFYVRVFRAIYNKAAAEGISGTNSEFVFRKLKLKTPVTTKRAIDLDVMQKVVHADVELNSSMDRARDVFMFSFYCRGMSFVDIVHLKYTDIIGNVIYYSRSKTKQPLRIKIEQPLMDIIEKYRNDSEYVLPILNPKKGVIYNQYRRGLRDVNDGLKKLSESLELTTKLTSYVARHTWATLAKKSGVDIPTISESLGHSSITTTNIYLAALDTSVIDDANSLVCNLLK